MASPSMQLCHRWTCVLRSESASVALLRSTRVPRHPPPPAARRSTTIPIRSFSSLIAGNHVASCVRQRWKRGVCYYSDLVSKPATTREEERADGKGLSGTEVVVSRPIRDGKGLSEPEVVVSQPIRDAAPATGGQTVLDLDAIPHLSALEEITVEEAVRISPSPAVPPASFSLRDYVDESETLRRLVELGVELWRLEQRRNAGSMLLKLDFQTDVAPRLLFLKDIGVELSRLGYMLSRNPFILTVNLEHLQDRVQYLKTMKFSAEDVASMVSRAPFLLSFSVKRLDNRLGFYQNQLGLSAQKTRGVVARHPRLLSGSLEPVKENLKVFKLELGFKENELQQLIIICPQVLTAQKRKLTQIFDYVHNTMEIPHHLIAKFPWALTSKYQRIRERHLFLQYLGKAQYDPAQPAYIPLDRLVGLPNDAFCIELASATLEDLELFQKTL